MNKPVIFEEVNLKLTNRIKNLESVVKSSIEVILNNQAKQHEQLTNQKETIERLMVVVSDIMKREAYWRNIK